MPDSTPSAATKSSTARVDTPSVAVHELRPCQWGEPLRLPLLLLIPWWLMKLVVRLLLIVAGSPVAVTSLTAVTLSRAAWRVVGPLVLVAG